MANPKILYTDLSTYTFTQYPSDIVSNTYPISNLSNYITSMYWESAYTDANTQLRIDMGSAVPADSVCIDNHNLTSVSCSYAPILEAADDASYSTGLVLVTTLTTTDDETCYKSFNEVTKRYWRVRYSSSAGLAEEPRIGNIFIGSALEFTTPYDYGYRSENAEYITNEKVTLSGIRRSSQTYKGRIVYELKFSLQDDTLRTNYQTFQRTVRGKLYPFYFIDTDGTIRYMNNDTDYSPVTTVNYGYNEIETLIMKTNTAVY